MYTEHEVAFFQYIRLLIGALINTLLGSSLIKGQNEVSEVMCLSKSGDHVNGL
jgi:hypothetical protein